MMTLKEQHDKLLEEMPEGASHDADGCPICNPENDDSFGGGDMKTYTEEEFTAAVQEAVAPLQAAAEARVAELEAQVTAMRASAEHEEAKGQIAEVQAELDKAELRVSAAEQKYADLVAALEEAAAAEAEATARSERQTERLEAVKANASFSDEYVSNNIDRWVAMSDEDFAALIEDWKAVSAASSDAEPSLALRDTAMSNLRDDKPTRSVASDVFGARNKGIDIRTLS